jgi:hypothetical protein
VSVEALRRADPPAKESYQMSLYADMRAIRVGQKSAKDCAFFKKKLQLNNRCQGCKVVFSLVIH